MESGSSTLRRSLAEGRAEYDNGRNLLLSVVTSFEEWPRVSPCEDLCEALWAFSGTISPVVWLLLPEIIYKLRIARNFRDGIYLVPFSALPAPSSGLSFLSF